jgi:hypothetical protein
MGIKNIEKLTVEDIKPITISFKKNEDELALYKWILGHSNYSGAIKDILRDIKESENNLNVAKPIKKAEKGLIDLDF